jgi:hypothetical protein
MVRDPDAVTLERARRTGRRAAHGVVLAVAIAFIGASSWQIVRAVFELNGPDALGNSLSDRFCSEGIHSMAAALDRATTGVAVALAVDARRLDEDDRIGLFASLLRPEWDAAATVQQRCDATRQGREAWAALQRLRMAGEQLGPRDQVELGPIRRDLAARLAPDLR